VPLISTIGGRPGEKNRSLILVDVFSIPTSNAGVDGVAGLGAGAVAAAVPVVVVAVATGGVVVGTDMSTTTATTMPIVGPSDER